VRLERLSRPANPSLADAIRRRGRDLEAQLANFMRLTPQTRILQVGLDGEGELHHFRTGVRYALEPLAGALAERDKLKWGSVRWVSGSGEQLPFGDRQLDAVLLTEVLEYTPSPARVLAEAYRCLRDDGVLWISSCVTSQRASTTRWQLTSGRIASACRKAYLSLLWSAKLAPARRDFVLRPQSRVLPLVA
jgi:SAM-dependent methyltransferase